MNTKTIDIITLGCSKNLVDSETLMARLEALGYKVEHDPEHPRGHTVVINTCGFIGDAKEESINTILQCCERKARGLVGRIYVMGCLSQRYLKTLGHELPEVDGIYGKFDWGRIIDDLNLNLNPNDNPSAQTLPLRHITTPRHYAYLKISEGCNRHCAYCAIPIMTGRHHSRPMDDIIAEVEWLVGQGVKELQVIAQELTYYGLDIYKKRCIAELVERMAHVKGVKWIRLHYAYPHQFPMDLLDVMRRNPNVCRYLDIALQHINSHVLTNMRRHVDSTQTYQLITQIRKAVPGIHLRTTLMVGFPGEGDREFEELIEFTRWARFERMGAFAYSHEDGTYAARHYRDTIPPAVKQARLDRLMALQQEISAQVQAEKVGQTLKVMIDRKEGQYYVGRTEFDSPEVDPEVLIPAAERRLRCGCFYKVRITHSDQFDLYGDLPPCHTDGAERRSVSDIRL